MIDMENANMRDSDITSQECAFMYPALVKTEGGRTFTTSLIVAKAFEREHKNVLRAIENLECSAEFRERNFALSSYTAETGNGTIREYPAYHLTRDAFVFLVMGFTGTKAAVWKETFLDAFNAMEAELLSPSSEKKCVKRSQAPTATYRHIRFDSAGQYTACAPETLKGLRGFIGFGAYLDGVDPAETEARLAANFQVTSLDKLAAMDARMAYALVERQVFRICDDDRPATPEERQPLEALLDFGTYAECGQEREILEKALAYLCNLPSLDELSAKGVQKAVFILWAFLTRFPPMKNDILKACSGGE